MLTNRSRFAVVITGLISGGLAIHSPLRSIAQVVPPGASGATTTTTYTQSVSRTASNTATFSRDQTFVLSGSNVNFNGAITTAGQPLGGVTQVESSPVDTRQLFPVISITSTYPSTSSDGLTTNFGAATVSSNVSREQITITSSDSASVQGVVLNPNMNATVRDPAQDFDLAITQSTPGLTQTKRDDTGTTTSQLQTSMSVFTAPFIP
jgi:hypothetical protein